MRFKSRDQAVPEINLIPMMDVLMTVLTFFVLVSMSLNGEQSPNLNLPGGRPGQTQAEPTTGPTLIVGLTAAAELTIEAETLSLESAKTKLRDRLRADPNLTLLLKADRTLPYQTVAKTLTTLRDLGGSRVSLVTQ